MHLKPGVGGICAAARVPGTWPPSHADEMLSPKTTMPRTIPATGSAAVMPRREVCGGAMLKGALHETQPGQGDSYQRVSGPAG